MLKRDFFKCVCIQFWFSFIEYSSEICLDCRLSTQASTNVHAFFFYKSTQIEFIFIELCQDYETGKLKRPQAALQHCLCSGDLISRFVNKPSKSEFPMQNHLGWFATQENEKINKVSEPVSLKLNLMSWETLFFDWKTDQTRFATGGSQRKLNLCNIYYDSFFAKDLVKHPKRAITWSLNYLFHLFPSNCGFNFS